MSNNVVNRGSYIRKAAGLNKSITAPIGAPVSFTASSPPLVAGQSAVFDTDALQPTYRQPYFIDEVRFRFRGTSLEGNSPTHHGPMAKFLFQTGGEKISKMPVPAWLYCPKWTPYEGYTQPIANVQQTTTFCRWLLPSPLWMGPGDVMQAYVERDVSLGEDFMPFIANITYIGRTLPPGTPPPPQRTVPWVSYVELRSQDISVGLPQGSLVIANEELRNPFMVPLDVQRLTVRGTNAGFAAGQYSELANWQLSTGSFDSIEMSLLDSAGYVVVPNDVLIGHSIEADRAAWTFNRNIGPREALHPKITINVAGEANVVQVGMIASRKVKL